MASIIHPREMWGAAPPTKTSRMRLGDGIDAVDIYVHYLGGKLPRKPGTTDVKVLLQTQRFHQGSSRNWSDIAYSFAVGQDAKAYECRGFRVSGAHTEGHNSTSYGIVFLLNVGELPTDAMYATFAELCEEIRQEHKARKIVVRPHSAAKATACPGPVLTQFAWDYTHAEDFPWKNVEKPTPTNPTVAERLDLLEIALADVQAQLAGVEVQNGLTSAEASALFRLELRKLVQNL